MSNRLFTISELLREINYLFEDGLSWAEIAKKIYPDEDPEKIRPILWRMANEGYYPKRNDVRARLRLPALKEIEACPDCNEVHTERCPKVDIEDLPAIRKIEEIPVCPVHGIVHCYDCQTQDVKPKRNGQPKRKRTPPVRIGEATDEEMELIQEYLTPDQRRKVLVNTAEAVKKFGG